MWKTFEKLKDKLTGAKTEEKPEAAKAAAGAKAPGLPDLKDLEKKGMMGQFFRHWKNPAFLKQLQVLTQRMQAEGVNIKDQKAVMEWVQAHQKEIASGELLKQPAGEAKPQTYVKTGPEIGRNDPCTCGSGKKFKKCCGANA